MVWGSKASNCLHQGQLGQRFGVGKGTFGRVRVEGTRKPSEGQAEGKWHRPRHNQAAKGKQLCMQEAPQALLSARPAHAWSHRLAGRQTEPPTPALQNSTGHHGASLSSPTLTASSRHSSNLAEEVRLSRGLHDPATSKFPSALPPPASVLGEEGLLIPLIC